MSGTGRASRKCPETHVAVLACPPRTQRGALASLAPAYAPRRPTETVLYRLVREHLESFLAYAREHYDGGLPAYVEAELRSYLKCGVFAEGFTRAHCESCGHDILVAFSCHGRSICPSCCGRRMANTAAHLVDRVLPDVPLRQYVLTLPRELRKLAAFKADVLTALARNRHSWLNVSWQLSYGTVPVAGQEWWTAVKHELVWGLVASLGLFTSGVYIGAALTKTRPGEPFRWSQLLVEHVSFCASSRRKLLFEGVSLLVLTIILIIWHWLHNGRGSGTP